MSAPNTETVRICRDEDCPECGWPETYAEVMLDAPTPGANAIGCSKCGWRMRADSFGPNLGPAVTVDGEVDGWFEGWPESTVESGGPA